MLPIKITISATLNILFHDLKIILSDSIKLFFNQINWEFDIDDVTTGGKTVCDEKKRLTDRKLRKLISSKEGNTDK